MEKPSSQIHDYTPLLPIKNAILFPHLIMPLVVGRRSSLEAVERAVSSEERELLVVTQKSAQVDDPSTSDLFTVGVRGRIKQLTRTGDRMDVFIQGLERVRLHEVRKENGFLEASYEVLPLPQDTGPEVEALSRLIVDLGQKIQAAAQPNAAVSITQLLGQYEDPIIQAFLIASLSNFDLEIEQQILEATTRADALRLTYDMLLREQQILEIRQKITKNAEAEMTREKKEYLLRQQLRAIQQELGDRPGGENDLDALREDLAKADLPEHVRKEADRELKRLERMHASSPDYQLSRTYLETLAELPWKTGTEDRLDLAHVREVLDNDHFGLNDVKDRIIEHIAVIKQNPKAKAPILCFVGPPGVGKTSLGESIATALNRKFERVSLGGLHDEAELRGHRRTYIGAMPGRLIQAVRRAKANNPLIMLDEIDKLGRDYRGDPSSALLEILDPSQNHQFRDNYLDLSFDLSRVFFVATANTLDSIPRPLLDRMEVIRLSGYTEEEKVAIAQRYLIPRQVKEVGLTEKEFRLEPAALLQVIRSYTREAGVRQLERQIGKLARKVVVQIAKGNTNQVAISPAALIDYLGVPKFSKEQSLRPQHLGVVPGLAWTEAGGDLLYVEAVLLPKGRGLTLTGQLGEVMQESAKAGYSFLWASAPRYGIDENKFRQNGVHVHVPQGAVPKDGPSAGITIATALASLTTGMPVRPETAMTGEITLSGHVLPIGGVKEKLLAAHRYGIKRVIIPKDNEPDLRDIPICVRKEMEIIPAENLEQVLSAAIDGWEHRKRVASALDAGHVIDSHGNVSAFGN